MNETLHCPRERTYVPSAYGQRLIINLGLYRTYGQRLGTVGFTELAARRVLKFATRLEEAMPVEAAFADATEAAVTATLYMNDARRASLQLIISTCTIKAQHRQAH